MSQSKSIPEISCQDVFISSQQKSPSDKLRIIDVRRPDEFYGELGHIQGAELFTLGAELSRFLESADRTVKIIFVCRSGGRSGNATLEAQQLGFGHTTNMVGGMLRWNELKLPVVKS